ncbi:MAG TPA: MFS transporter [Thermomicrobiales bacterium]|nr:MFS transporter [Thermomicrobiales bacterium]
MKRGAPSGGILHSLRVHAAFRLLMLGTLAADSAFWMYQVSVGWLAFQMTDSAAFVGVAGFAGGIPLLLVSLPAGVIIDRFDKRKILLAAQIGVMLVAATFAVLVGTGSIGRVQMLALVATYGTLMAFVFSTRTTMVPSLVDRHNLPNAVALNSAAHNSTRVIGPSLAGILIGVLGVAETFAVAATLQALALLATMRLPRLAREATTGGGALWSGLTVGFRVVAKQRYLTALIVLALAPAVLVMPYINLMPVFAREVLDLGSSGLGILLASTGLGTVAGSLALARIGPGLTGSRNQIFTALIFAACILAFAASPAVAVAVPLLFMAGAVSSSFFAMNQTALQLSVEDEVRGRVLSIYQLTWGALPFGQLLVGILAGRLGPPMALGISCLLAMISILAISYRFPSLWVRSMRQREPAGSIDPVGAGPGSGGDVRPKQESPVLDDLDADRVASSA